MAEMVASLQLSPLPILRPAQSSSDSLDSWTSKVPPSMSSDEEDTGQPRALNYSSSLRSQTRSNEHPSTTLNLTLYSQDSNGNPVAPDTEPPLLGSPLVPLSPDYILPNGQNGRYMTYSPSHSFLVRYNSDFMPEADRARVSRDGFEGISKCPVSSTADISPPEREDESAGGSDDEEGQYRLPRWRLNAVRNRRNSPYPLSAAHAGAGSGSGSDPASPLDSDDTLPVVGSTPRRKGQRPLKTTSPQRQIEEETEVAETERLRLHRCPSTFEKSRQRQSREEQAASRLRSSAKISPLNIAREACEYVADRLPDAEAGNSRNDNGFGQWRRAPSTRHGSAGGRQNMSSSSRGNSSRENELASPSSVAEEQAAPAKRTGYRKITPEQLADREQARLQEGAHGLRAPDDEPTGKRRTLRSLFKDVTPRESRPPHWDNPNDEYLTEENVSRGDRQALYDIRDTMGQLYQQQLHNGPGVSLSVADSLDFADYSRTARMAWDREARIEREAVERETPGFEVVEREETADHGDTEHEATKREVTERAAIRHEVKAAEREVKEGKGNLKEEREEKKGKEREESKAREAKLSNAKQECRRLRGAQRAAERPADVGSRRIRILADIRELSARVMDEVRDGMPSKLINVSRTRPFGRLGNGEYARLPLQHVSVVPPLPAGRDWAWLQEKRQSMPESSD
ncbi:hypothetical protein Micbo1qcDRAFT_208579 [Microdochium bolleyi]|uniref:Uncharacterized protein n=1 Tax=Microdochium bolleyi TaxID=196109 RepID=A0A136IPF0_9PEZI|nr:hypothetical protein Micbo1qcDRAFT_208579 [Microdochium bolleyi]